MSNHPHRRVSGYRARQFAAAYNRGDTETCDRVARAVTGDPHARGGLPPHQRWDQDARLTPRRAREFLLEL